MIRGLLGSGWVGCLKRMVGRRNLPFADEERNTACAMDNLYAANRKDRPMNYNHKPRLVIITGAGASAGVVPTAKCLTNAPTLVKSPFITEIEQSLNNEEPAYTFEDVLHRCQQTARDYQNNTEYANSIEQYFHSVLEVMLRRLDKPHVGTPALATILDSLSTRFSLTLATLNWDDIPLRSQIPWYSGFIHGQFDADYLEHVYQFEHRVLWLHGSLHFLIDPGTPPSIMWANERENIRHATLLPTISTADSASTFFGPIITGKEKRGQVMRRPFLDYRFVLYHDLLQADALLIIGYRGGDTDLNEILRAALWEDPRGRKHIVRVDYAENGQNIPELFQWFNDTCGPRLRFCPPPSEQQIMPQCGLVRISGPEFGNHLSQVTSTHTYIDLGGLQSASNHLSRIMDALQ